MVDCNMGEFSIQISANLINRLAEDDEKLKKRTRKTKPRVPREPRQPETKVDQKQISDDSEKQKETTGTGWPVPPPLILPANQPQYPAIEELDAIRSVVKESENVVEKLRKQEENMVQEVTQKAKELHEKEFKIPEPKPMPCLVENNACMECYKENVNDLTKCAPLAQNFADCARRVRQLAKSTNK
ncbi:hypothetical protein like AT4G12340 [Hibiscus trionum]|uniref:Uncharacterized protein n=1 Tax=Hibiscus trionum TaxID=183268 RepID=A0A9W7J1R5_HIBTR|nr:hypothetical protein like AT4G12340 [Hibiscus trionum]